MELGLEVLGILGGLLIGGVLGLLTPMPGKEAEREPELVPVPVPVEEKPERKPRSD